MEHNVLLVFNRNKESLVDEIVDIFEQSVFIEDLDGMVDHEHNLDKAKKRLRSRKYDLLIVDLHAPKDSTVATSADDWDGFEFVKELHSSGHSIPSIIVTSMTDDRLSYQLSKLPKCWALSLGEHFNTLLVNMSVDAIRTYSKKGKLKSSTKKKLENTTKREKKHKLSLVLEIYILDEPALPEFKIRGFTGNETVQRHGVLDIDRELIDDLKARCMQNMQEMSKHWEDELKRIGKELFKELFRRNPDFSNQLYECLARIDPEKQFMIRFNVGKMAHPLALEALFDHKKDLFWMLMYPTSRQIAISGDYYELLIGRPDKDQRINCLIIEADVEGRISIASEIEGNAFELQYEFPKLANVKKESRFLEKLLVRNDIGTVVRIDKNGQKQKFSEIIQETLTEQQFQLVHFAGHTYYDKRNKKGYLILPGKDYPEILDVEEFGAWLRLSHTQFVFLSSCRSSEDDFVFELASKQIPAILGFRWDLNDARAYEYAKSFYTHLFLNKNPMEYAFLEARKEMYKKHRKDRIWAAPMLVLQTNEW